MTPVTPEGEVTVAGTPFRLDPSFKTLAALQHAFRQDLVEIQARVFDMRLDEVATLLATASGNPVHEVGQLLIDELDVSGGDYQMLKAELMGWLGVAMTPRRDREKKRLLTAATLAGVRSRSPGPSTAGSASGPSAGDPPSSGAPPSGT